MDIIHDRDEISSNDEAPPLTYKLLNELRVYFATIYLECGNETTSADKHLFRLELLGLDDPITVRESQWRDREIEALKNGLLCGPRSYENTVKDVKSMMHEAIGALLVQWKNQPKHEKQDWWKGVEIHRLRALKYACSLGHHCWHLSVSMDDDILGTLLDDIL